MLKGGVTNAAGEPLVGKTKMTPVTVTAQCDYSTFQLVNDIFNDTISQLETINIVATSSQLTPSLRYFSSRYVLNCAGILRCSFRNQ